MRKTTQNEPIVAAASRAVKAQIVAEGVSFGALARAAHIEPSTLSDYLSGRRHSPETQFRIWVAFRRITGRRPMLERFWGDLLAKDAA